MDAATITRHARPWIDVFPISRACARQAASAPASATAFSASSCARKGHLSADDLCDLVRREDPGIGRATVYRTLQWMVGAGIARKVDFGEGRSRFEPSYRHPRHFHLVCNDCHRSSEFLSSDIESLIEEIAAARNFDADADRRADLRHVRGVPHRREDRDRSTAATTELVFARDALRIAIATERSGLEFYTRAAELTNDPRGRSVFQRLAAEEQEHLGTLEKRYAELLSPRIRSSNRGRRSCSSRARPADCSPKAPRSCARASTIMQALLIGIKCERGSHKFFKRYGERFEDSEGKRIFLEFAGRGARAPRPAHPRVPRAARATAAPGRDASRPRSRRRVRRRVDRPPYPHHRLRRPLLRRRSSSRARSGRGVTVLSVTDHDTLAGCEAARRGLRRGRHRVRSRHRDHRRRRRR